MKIAPAGHSALLVLFDESPSQELSLRLTQLAHMIKTKWPQKILVTTPSWNTLLVQFNLLLTNYEQLKHELYQLLTRLENTAHTQITKTIELPVWYNGEDLAYVAEACHLTESEVIDLHSSTDYFVGAIGFTPGFAYLATLSEALRLPRRKTPRTHVPAGSVAIAEQQTAVYPTDSPGGWHLLGLCPTQLVNWENSSPIIFQVGDLVRFTPISKQQYRELIA